LTEESGFTSSTSSCHRPSWWTATALPSSSAVSWSTVSLAPIDEMSVAAMPRYSWWTALGERSRTGVRPARPAAARSRAPACWSPRCFNAPAITNMSAQGLPASWRSLADANASANRDLTVNVSQAGTYRPCSKAPSIARTFCSTATRTSELSFVLPHAPRPAAAPPTSATQSKLIVNRLMFSASAVTPPSLVLSTTSPPR
jgi:hypothetical protein